MSSQSQYAGVIEVRSVGITPGVSPVGTHVNRNVMVNNSIRLYELNAQNRICWVSDSGAAPYAHRHGAAGGVTAGEWFLTSKQRFFTRLRENNAPFKYRVRLAGRMPSGGTGDYRIGIGHPDSLRDDVLTGSGRDNVAEVTGITATSSAWLALDATVLTCNSRRVEQVSFGAHDAVSAGKAITVVMNRMELQVWCKTTDTTQKPRVTGLLVQEFVG